MFAIVIILGIFIPTVLLLNATGTTLSDTFGYKSKRDKELIAMYEEIRKKEGK